MQPGYGSTAGSQVLTNEMLTATALLDLGSLKFFGFYSAKKKKFIFSFFLLLSPEAKVKQIKEKCPVRM